MKSMGIDYVLVQLLVCNHRFCYLEFKVFLPTWDMVIVSTLSSDAIMLCIELEQGVLLEG